MNVMGCMTQFSTSFANSPSDWLSFDYNDQPYVMAEDG